MVKGTAEISGTKQRLTALLLIAILTTAAAPRDLYREAKQLYDRGDWPALAAFTADALQRVPADSDEAAKLRVLRAEAMFPDPAAVALVTRELPPSLRNSEVAVIRLRILGILAFKGKHDDEARKLMDAALALAKSRHPELVADVLVPRGNMGRIYTTAALETYANEAVRYAVRYKNVRSELNARGQLAKIYGRQERFDEAVVAGEKAHAMAVAANNKYSQAAMAGNLGWFWAELGNDELAEQYLQEALSLPGDKTNIPTWYLQFGNAATLRGDLQTAEKNYQQALTLAKQYNPEKRGPALANLASIAIETGRIEDARRYNSEALAVKRDAQDQVGIQRSQILDARIDRETKRLNEAKQTLEKVLAHPETRLMGVEAETELARVFAGLEDTSSAEKHFASALAAIADARDEISGDEMKLAFANVSAGLYHDYVDFLVAAGRSRDALRVAELSRARTLAEGLGVEREKKDDIDPEAIAKSANVTVLSYWLAPERSFLFVVTPQGVQHFVLPPAKAINDAVDAYQKDFDNLSRGAALYTMLVAPAEGTIRGNRIAVIPDGHLAAFNFETLRTPKRRYWIEDVTIESANALQFVAAPRKAERGKLLLIGNPPKTDPLFPPLPHAAEEIASVERYFDRHTTLTGAAATPGAYAKAKPENYAYVHFVAHGVATRQRPLDSAVILGRDAGGYKLYARDVVQYPAPLKARLVTISSCHGAGRRAFAGEGLVGLAWAFLRAGAHEVVAALWEVNDTSTARLMNAMYKSIHDGQAPVDALRAAKLSLLRSNEIFRKPKYWAPFVLYSGS